MLTKWHRAYHESLFFLYIKGGKTSKETKKLNENSMICTCHKPQNDWACSIIIISSTNIQLFQQIKL
jgi:hypothetical protein